MNRAELISALTLTLEICVLHIFFFSVIVGRYMGYVEQFGTKNFQECEMQSKLLII